MAYTTVDYFGFALLVLGMLGVLYLLLSNRVGRQKKLAKIAEELNGTFFPGPIYDYDGPDKWYELNIIEWKKDDIPFRFYDSVDTTNHTYTKYMQSYLQIELPKRYPHFKLLKYSDEFLTDMETDNEFKENYNLYTDEVNQVVDMFNMSLRQYFIDYSFYNIECDGHRLKCYKTKEHIPETEIMEMAHWLENSYKMLNSACVN